MYIITSQHVRNEIAALKNMLYSSLNDSIMQFRTLLSGYYDSCLYVNKKPDDSLKQFHLIRLNIRLNSNISEHSFFRYQFSYYLSV